MGAGPMTVAPAGVGYDRPLANAVPGFEEACYPGGGAAGNMYYATGLPAWARGGVIPPAPPVQATPDQEMMELRTQASWLAQQLEAIQRRIEALGSGNPQP